MSGYAFLAVFCGAGLGAVLRWGLNLWLNPLFPTMPLGTVAANLIGGFLVGVAISYFSHNSHLAPEWRLLVITGFMGGLTTFSTFSVEVVHLLQRQEPMWALATAGVHLIGSLVLTALGILLGNVLLNRL